MCPQCTRLIFNGQSCTPPNQDNVDANHTSVRRKLFSENSGKSEETIYNLCTDEKDTIENCGMQIISETMVQDW